MLLLKLDTLIYAGQYSTHTLSIEWKQQKHIEVVIFFEEENI